MWLSFNAFEPLVDCLMRPTRSPWNRWDFLSLKMPVTLDLSELSLIGLLVELVSVSTGTHLTSSGRRDHVHFRDLANHVVFYIPLRYFIRK